MSETVLSEPCSARFRVAAATPTSGIAAASSAAAAPAPAIAAAVNPAAINAGSRGAHSFDEERGAFGCSPGTKTGTRVRSHVPPERKPERGYVRQNHPFAKPPFYLPVNCTKVRGVENRCPWGFS